MSLAVNARDAMLGGGTLCISTGNADADADARYVAEHPGQPPGRYVRLRMRDTGVGMSPEGLAQAFEPFFTTKTDGTGTGLGLTTVYGIVHQAGGTVTIDSEPGAGTTVSALLPASDRPLAEPDRRDHARPPDSSAGRTILLVEDEAPLREVTARVLARNGFRVIVAGNGPEAIQVAEQERDTIDLLTDVVMPEMFGKAVAAEVRARRPGVRVLFRSGCPAGAGLPGHPRPRCHTPVEAVRRGRPAEHGPRRAGQPRAAVAWPCPS